MHICFNLRLRDRQAQSKSQRSKPESGLVSVNDFEGNRLTHSSLASIALVGRYRSRVSKGFIRVRDARATNFLQCQLRSSSKRSAFGTVSGGSLWQRYSLQRKHPASRHGLLGTFHIKLDSMHLKRELIALTCLRSSCFIISGNCVSLLNLGCNPYIPSYKNANSFAQDTISNRSGRQFGIVTLTKLKQSTKPP